MMICRSNMMIWWYNDFNYNGTNSIFIWLKKYKDTMSSWLHEILVVANHQRPEAFNYNDDITNDSHSGHPIWWCCRSWCWQAASVSWWTPSPPPSPSLPRSLSLAWACWVDSWQPTPVGRRTRTRETVNVTGELFTPRRKTRTRSGPAYHWLWVLSCISRTVPVIPTQLLSATMPPPTPMTH